MGKKKAISRDISRDTSDPEQVQSDEDMKMLRDYVSREMLQKVLKTYEGRHVIFQILSKGDIYNQHGKSYDPNVLNRQVGRDEVAQEVLSEVLTAMPDVYTMMQKEAAEFNARYSFTEVGRKEEDDG